MLARKLTVCFRQVHDAESLWKHVALADIMNPLLRQEQLEVLRIRVPSTRLTESDIQDTVTAWPDLRELSLVSGGHESTLPITVLSSFAFHHPSLYSLEMGLVCHIDVQALSSANIFTSHELRQIRLRRRDGEATSPTGKVVLANYLDGLFPRLEMVGTDRFSPPEASSYWDEIAVILNCLQRARARETCRLKVRLRCDIHGEFENLTFAHRGFLDLGHEDVATCNHGRGATPRKSAREFGVPLREGIYIPFG